MNEQAPVFEFKAELFKALAHPARIRALEILADGEHSVSQLVPDVGIEPAHLSQQLGVLRRVGLVTKRKEGTAVYYSIKDELLVELLAVAGSLLIRTLAQARDLLEELQTPSYPGTFVAVSDRRTKVPSDLG